MKTFACSVCSQVVFFESASCTTCGSVLAYLPDVGVVSTLELDVNRTDGVYLALAPRANGRRYRQCANWRDYNACNWAVGIEDPIELCRSCRLNDVIPNLDEPGRDGAWRRIEAAKRRLVYSIIELGLPLESKEERPDGLAFSFKADDPGGKKTVFTGHNDGMITLNIAEADAPFREKTRLQLGEQYRTLLGHFRHEIGHYYWSRLVENSPKIHACRALFGDEREDYQAAMKRHYDQGTPPDWQSQYVSPYAAMHPWEDFAESWAHYLHMVNTLGTARAFGLALRPKAVDAPAQEELTSRRVDIDDFDELINAWFPLTIALNSLNRSMGLPDVYPFVLSAPAVAKLRFVHEVIDEASHRPTGHPRA